MAKIDDLKQELENLRQEYSKLTGEQAPLFNVQNINEANSAIKTMNRSISDAREEVLRLEDGFSGVYGELQGILQEISKSESATNKVTKALRGTASIARELKNEEAGFNKLSLKELKQRQKRQQSLSEEINLQADLVKNKIEETRAGQNALKTGLLKDKNNKELSKSALKARALAMGITVQELKANAAIIEAQNDQFKALKDQDKLLEGRIKKEEQINELMGLGGAAVEAIGGALNKLGMGGLKEALGLDEVSDRMRGIAEERLEELKEGLKEGEEATLGFSDKMKVLQGGIKEAGNQLITNLKDPLAISSFIATQLIDALISVDEQAGKLAKNFGISYDAALGLKSELTNSANQSYLLNINSQGLVESFITLNNLFGTFAQINEQVLEDFSRLTKEAFVSNEAAVALYKTTLLTGKGLEESTKEFLGQSAALAAQNGLALNQKQLLESVKDVSTSTLLIYDGQVDRLAEAAVNAKALGLNLSQVEQIANSLVQFESSIRSELEAELFTGKQLNLERARYAALTGDIATVAEEVAQQIGTSEDFTNMNVIAQEKLAKAVGLTRDDLAKSLMEREAMAKLSDQEGKTAQERFNNLVKEVGMEEAKRRLGDESLANLYSQQNVQERFTAAVEKLKDVFVAIAEPVLQIVSPFVDLVTTILPAVNALLNPILKYAKEIAAVFGSIYLTNKLMVATNAFILAQEEAKTTQKGIQIGFTETLLTMMGFENALAEYRHAREEGMNVLRAIGVALEETKLGSIIAQGYGIVKNIGKLAIENTARLVGMTTALATNAAVTFGTGVAIAVGAALAGVAAIKAITADDMVQDGYGKRTILSPEGAIRLNDKDTIVAGTDLLPNNTAGTDLLPNNTTNNTTTNTTTNNTTTPSPNMVALEQRMDKLISVVENALIPAVKQDKIFNLDGKQFAVATAVSRS